MEGWDDRRVVGGVKPDNAVAEVVVLGEERSGCGKQQQLPVVSWAPGTIRRPDPASLEPAGPRQNRPARPLKEPPDPDNA